MSTLTQLKTVADFACGCAEGPLWHPQENRLYWTDVDGRAVFRVDPHSGEAAKIFEGDTVGGMTLHEDGRLLFFMAAGAIRLWGPDGMETLLSGIESERNTRFNDVIADPQGRVFCGTMPDGDRSGRLYRWDPDGRMHLILEDVGQPNGMGFSPDCKTFYLTDTKGRRIERFAYQVETGELSNRRVFLEVPEDEGSPDGMTIDSQGFLWSARWDGSRLVRHNLDGRPVETIEMPVRNITSLTFACKDYATVFVTTAGGGHDPSPAGAVLQFSASVAGKPEFTSRRTPE